MAQYPLTNLTKVIQGAAGEILKISSVSVKGKVKQSNPKLLNKDKIASKITKGYTWLAFNDISLTDNGLLYVYYR